ncbi:TetR/AcrR family transcriptional regulator [Pseudonocardia asaccharolytica]|uniref:TetR family transcriptional regulator n=1 Tax=Pseudonocardia asaccharolytica DSM 44247 = NBRC 16224 TaxID=1123024 RepID=A0A511D3M9_9PSEU|nr:TetR/AcrR family transcriptional regulator [Pseudonocardia asaccharolytica]GEL19391.1 TetR family transcriptional regulator [Pseudonocardia asaccharolytica DSM 44247 = NBRC 16224]
MAGSVKRRRYRSTIPRGQARAAVLAAAGRLFAERGFQATSIEDIAAAAGVARPTVFTAVGGKSVILKEVVDIALAGDEEEVAVSDRPWFREMIDQPDPRRMLRLHARNIRTMYERVAGVYCAVEAAAAAADPEAGALWETLQAQRLAGSRTVAAALTGKATLRAGYDEEAVTDTLWSLGAPMIYRKVVLERGWSPQRYEEWIADALCRMFLPD